MTLPAAVKKNVGFHLHMACAEEVRGQSGDLRWVGMHSPGVVIHPPVPVGRLVSCDGDVMARVGTGSKVDDDALEVVRYPMKVHGCVRFDGVQQSS